MSKVLVRDLRKRYGAIEAAAGVTFEIQEGEIFGLIGPNGAGKTTALECVIGLREPDEGVVEVCGIDARRRPREVKQKIGAALQTTALQDKITPREALSLFGSFYRNAIASDVLLERFGLTDKAAAAFDTLSGGQRQRLALALAFVNDPDVLFVDEPTAGLDPHSRRELHAEIARMKHEGRTVWLTTHYLDEAETLCDRIAIIDHGHIIATGTPRELTAQSSAMQSVTVTTTGSLDAERLARLPGVHDVHCDAATVRFHTVDAHRTVAELMKIIEAQRLELVELRVHKATLEDIFIELTDGSTKVEAGLSRPGRAEARPSST